VTNAETKLNAKQLNENDRTLRGGENPFINNDLRLTPNSTGVTGRFRGGGSPNQRPWSHSDDGFMSLGFGPGRLVSIGKSMVGSSTWRLELGGLLSSDLI